MRSFFDAVWIDNFFGANLVIVASWTSLCWAGLRKTGRSRRLLLDLDPAFNSNCEVLAYMASMPPQFLPRDQRIKFEFGAMPSGIEKVPARDLSAGQARDVVVALAVQSEFTIKELKISDDFKLVTPKAEDAARVTIEPNIIAGIPFRLDNGTDFGLKPITLPFAVVLWRMATMLKKDWGAKIIYAGGIGIGGDANLNDCHNQGRCVDFFGADTDFGNFRVYKDWGLRNFIRPDKKVGNTWLGYTGNTFYYRLRHLPSPSPNDAAAEFFEAIYQFAQQQCRDMGGTPTTIGQPSYIMHPDHPDPKREAHQNHVHFQLGAT